MALSRRSALALIASAVAAPAFSAERITLQQMIQHPLLRKAYASRHAVYDAQFSAGINRGTFQLVEDQRQGTEEIIAGLVTDAPARVALGWKILDRGLDFQQPDGGFGKWSYFHSTSLFVEALARAMILDPGGATATRKEALGRARDALARPDPKGWAINAPFTHRRYIVAAAFGETATVLSSGDAPARRWARQGLSLQRADGVNPEKGGYDASYQIVGPLHALRYLPVCRDAALAGDLRGMVRRAVTWELGRMNPDGSIDPGASTRLGGEVHFGHAKTMNYHELLEVLVYGAQVIEPGWTDAAERVARLKGWA